MIWRHGLRSDKQNDPDYGLPREIFEVPTNDTDLGTTSQICESHCTFWNLNLFRGGLDFGQISVACAPPSPIRSWHVLCGELESCHAMGQGESCKVTGAFSVVAWTSVKYLLHGAVAELVMARAVW